MQILSCYSTQPVQWYINSTYNPIKPRWLVNGGYSVHIHGFNKILRLKVICSGTDQHGVVFKAHASVFWGGMLYYNDLL